LRSSADIAPPRGIESLHISRRGSKRRSSRTSAAGVDSDQEKARSLPGPLDLRPASAAECVTFDLALVFRLVVRAAVPAGEPAAEPAGEPVSLDLGLVARLDVRATEPAGQPATLPAGEPAAVPLSLVLRLVARLAPPASP